MNTLVLGGARSGKSRYAEQLALQSAKKVVYIATATAGDAEMQVRINQHQQQRPEDWQLIEEPLKLVQAIEGCGEQCCVLVDCLTLWLSNLLAESDSFAAEQIDELISCVERREGEVIFVSNEVGMGIVPMGELSRRFVDESGRLHQRLAAVCERVVLTVAGIPQVIKGK